MSDLIRMVLGPKLLLPIGLPIMVSVFTLFGASSTLHAQVNNCEVVGPAANVVCSDLNLTQLSDQLASAIRALLGTTDRPNRRALIREQRDWSLGNRNCLANDGSIECLSKAYEARISDLASRLDSAIEVAETEEAGEVPVASGELPPLTGSHETVPGGRSEAAEIAAAAASGAGIEADSSAEADNDETLGGFRGEPAGTPELSPDDREVGFILTANVWKADIATGVRPGTIFVFQKDGALVTADCVESYKLGNWAIDADSKLTIDDGSGSTRNAEIISARDRFVRLQIDGSGERRSTLVLRPAIVPFSCKSG